MSCCVVADSLDDSFALGSGNSFVAMRVKVADKIKMVLSTHYISVKVADRIKNSLSTHYISESLHA